MYIIAVLVIVFIAGFSDTVAGKGKIVLISGIFGIWLGLMVTDEMEYPDDKVMIFFLCALIPTLIASFEAISLYFQKIDCKKIIKKIPIKKFVKMSIFVMGIIFCVMGVNVYRQHSIEKEIKNNITMLAENKGLIDVDISVGVYSDSLYTISVSCSNLDEFTYKELFELDKALTIDNVIVTQYLSSGDSYEVFPYTRSISKNGKEVFNDYWNSESHIDDIIDKNYTFDSNKKDYGEYTVTEMRNGYEYRCKRCGWDYRLDHPLSWKGCIECDDISSVEWYEWYKKAIGYKDEEK